MPEEQAAAAQLAARGRRCAFGICLRLERSSMVSCLAANSNSRLIASRTFAVPLDKDMEISSEMSAACLVSPIVSPNVASALATVLAFFEALAASVAMLEVVCV